MSASEFISFLNKCPSPYHVVDQARTILLEAGYQELNERVKWDLKRNSKYFLTRNKSSILSFAIGGKYVPGNPFVIIGTHCDSPALKVRPISKREKEGILQVSKIIILFFNFFLFFFFIFFFFLNINKKIEIKSYEVELLILINKTYTHILC